MTRTTLRDELGMLEAERDRIKAENESLKIRIAKQAGAQNVTNAMIRYLEGRVEKLTEYNTTLKVHFYQFHGTAERIAAQHHELAAAEKASEPPPSVAEVVNSPEVVDSIKSRIDRLFAGKEKAPNGVAA